MQAPPQPPDSRRDRPPARDRPAALRHLDAAYNLARWLTRDEAKAQDVVQSACLETFGLLQSPHDEDTRDRLMRIVRNACYARAPRSGDDAKEDAHRAADNDDRRRTNDALRDLPIELREVIVLREMENLPYGAISSITGVAVGVVMSRLGLARARLMRCLELEGT